jgi:hypothetical protein
MCEKKEKSYVKELIILIGLLVGSYIYCNRDRKLLKLRPIVNNK